VKKSHHTDRGRKHVTHAGFDHASHLSQSAIQPDGVTLPMSIGHWGPVGNFNSWRERLPRPGALTGTLTVQGSAELLRRW